MPRAAKRGVRVRLLVGSMNLDPRSRLTNTEVAVLLESEQIGAELAALFDEVTQPANAFHLVLCGSASEQMSLIWISEDDGKEVRQDQEPAGFWRHFVAGVLSSLAPDELL